MKNIAFIALRGGSKRVPLKNIKHLNHRPLSWYAIQAAHDCPYINEVVVATDSDDIVKGLGSITSSKIVFYSTPKMDDQCMQESVMYSYAEANDFDNIVLLQATSPLVTSQDLIGGFNLYYQYPDCGSVVSVCRQKRFFWYKQADGYAYPQNYNPRQRKREQEWDGVNVENGAFFITSREALMKTKCRISGQVLLYEMPEDTYQQVDTDMDFIIIEQLLKGRIANGKS